MNSNLASLIKLWLKLLQVPVLIYACIGMWGITKLLTGIKASIYDIAELLTGIKNRKYDVTELLTSTKGSKYDVTIITYVYDGMVSYFNYCYETWRDFPLKSYVSQITL